MKEHKRRNFFCIFCLTFVDFFSFSILNLSSLYHEYLVQVDHQNYRQTLYKYLTRNIDINQIYLELENAFVTTATTPLILVVSDEYCVTSLGNIKKKSFSIRILCILRSMFGKVWSCGHSDTDTAEMSGLRMILETTSRDMLEWLVPLEPHANRILIKNRFS